MGKRSFSKDLSLTMLSNMVVLFGGIITGFIVPKAIGVDEYGLYKLFSLYMTYGALMHFGFVDGILLRYGGADYEELDKPRFRMYSRCFIGLETALAAVLLVGIQLLMPQEHKLLFSLLAVNVLVVNLVAYYQYVSQATMRFRELSARKILLSVMKIAVILLLILLRSLGVISEIRAVAYCAGLTLADLIVLLMYLRTYRSITIGSADHFAEHKADFLALFRDGVILTVSYEAAAIIFSLDRQFVSVLYDNRTYGVYSFAYNLIGMVITVVNAVSLVLFPTLRRLKEGQVMKTFTDGMGAISMVAFGAVLGYQPLCALIQWILPEYAHSLAYLRIIFPGLALSCSISVIMFTFYKVLNRHVVYFKVCCAVLVIAAALNWGAYQLFHTPESISVASIVSLLIWYCLCLRFFVVHYGVPWKRHLAYILVLMAAFYGLSRIANEALSWLGYAACYVAVSWLLYRRLIVGMVRKVLKRGA